MEQILQELAKLSPQAQALIVAVIGATGIIVAAVITAIVGKLIATPLLGARDKQDREVEWRKHALELTKLDLERKLRTRAATETKPLRPSILDFLANYRDLTELGSKSPAELYEEIRKSRINLPSEPAAEQKNNSVAPPGATTTPGSMNPDPPAAAPGSRIKPTAGTTAPPVV